MYAITKINLENFQRHCFEELNKMERENKEEIRAEIQNKLMNFIIHETQKDIILSAKDENIIDKFMLSLEFLRFEISKIK